MADWTDRIVGARMTVDDEFQGRIAESDFTNQEWGIVMTAVEFDIENPENPADAELVADTSKVDQVMSAVEDAGNATGAVGGPAGAAPDSAGGSGGGGLLDSIMGALGLGGGGGGDGRLDEAVALADEYAERLQEQLESNGQWQEVCRVAAEDAETE